MESIEKKYEGKYELLRNEIFTVERFFYAYKTIRNELAKEKIYIKAGDYSEYWVTVLASLYSNFFIVLGRIFDSDTSAFSINHFINFCIKNITLFSKEQLKKRREKFMPPDDLEEYMEKFPNEIVSVEEFRTFKRYINRHKKIYDDKYRDIRHKIVAHIDLKTLSKKEDLFEGTSIGEIMKILDILNKAVVNIRELYINGKKLDINNISIETEPRDMLIKDTENILNDMVRD